MNSTPQATPQAQATDTQTQQQTDALIAQIEAVMTPEQIKAIADMKITQDTLKEVMQAQGITMNGPQGASGTPSAGGQQGNGQPPSGGPGNNGFVPPELVKALVQYLQKAAGG